METRRDNSEIDISYKPIEESTIREIHQIIQKNPRNEVMKIFGFENESQLHYYISNYYILNYRLPPSSNRPISKTEDVTLSYRFLKKLSVAEAEKYWGNDYDQPFKKFKSPFKYSFQYIYDQFILSRNLYHACDTLNVTRKSLYQHIKSVLSKYGHNVSKHNYETTFDYVKTLPAEEVKRISDSKELSANKPFRKKQTQHRRTTSLSSISKENQLQNTMRVTPHEELNQAQHELQKSPTEFSSEKTINHYDQHPQTSSLSREDLLSFLLNDLEDAFASSDEFDYEEIDREEIMNRFYDCDFYSTASISNEDLLSFLVEDVTRACTPGEPLPEPLQQVRLPEKTSSTNPRIELPIPSCNQSMTHTMNVLNELEEKNSTSAPPTHQFYSSATSSRGIYPLLFNAENKSVTDSLNQETRSPKRRRGSGQGK